MATEDLKAKLKPGSFRGAFLFVTGITQSGGKAHAKKKIPDSDLQKVEDLGNNDPTYVVSGFISPRYQVSTNDGDPESISENPTYALMRDTLIAAFKMPGYGIQVNPFGPDIDFAMCIEWSIGEAQTTLGLTPVSYTLEISSLDALLTEDSSTQAQVDAADR